MELGAVPNAKYDDQADSTSQAFDWLKQLNVTRDCGLGLFTWADVILAGLDNREARLWINRSSRSADLQRVLIRARDDSGAQGEPQTLRVPGHKNVLAVADSLPRDNRSHKITTLRGPSGPMFDTTQDALCAVLHSPRLASGQKL
jgi:hypothetical protein